MDSRHVRKIVVIGVCGSCLLLTLLAWITEPKLKLQRVTTSVKFHRWDERLIELRGRESKNSNCSVRFAPRNNHPYTALASFPGSGNTWLRHLLEISTGIYTSSPYYDGTLYDGGFLGEGLDHKEGRTVVAKTHEFYPIKSDFKTAIVLIRNPFDAFVADFNRIKGDHVGFANSESFHEQSWYEYVLDAAPAWEIFHTNWLLWNHPTYFVLYEDLVNSTVDKVIEITEFLNVTLDEERHQCLVDNTEGQFHRHPQNQNALLKKNVYSKRMSANINKRIETVNELLVSKGLKPYSLNVT
ncbi:sialate:O-sulfotransferase 1-like [Glandiceps talaboti]